MLRGGVGPAACAPSTPRRTTARASRNGGSGPSSGSTAREEYTRVDEGRPPARGYRHGHDTDTDMTPTATPPASRASSAATASGGCATTAATASSARSRRACAGSASTASTPCTCTTPTSTSTRPSGRPARRWSAARRGRRPARGAGMNRVAPLLRIVRETAVDQIMVAGRYTLLDRSAGEELLPLAPSAASRVVAAGVYNSGLLADPRPGAPYDYAPADPAHRRARPRAARALRGARRAAAGRRRPVPAGSSGGAGRRGGVPRRRAGPRRGPHARYAAAARPPRGAHGVLTGRSRPPARLPRPDGAGRMAVGTGGAMPTYLVKAGYTPDGLRGVISGGGGTSRPRASWPPWRSPCC